MSTSSTLYPLDWTVSSDGKRFLLVVSAESTSAPTHIKVISSVIEELQAAVNEEHRRAKQAPKVARAGG